MACNRKQFHQNLSSHRQVAQLPEVYDERLYADFIASYGTHYVSAGIFGGRAKLTTTLDRRAFAGTTHFDAEYQLGVTFAGFGGSTSGSHSANSRTKAWNAATSSTLYLEGGDPAFGSFNTDVEFDEWSKSVNEHAPVMISYTLQPISRLIWTKSKQANVAAAVASYANHSIQHSVDLTKAQWTWGRCAYAGQSTSENQGLFVCPTNMFGAKLILGTINSHDGLGLCGKHSEGCTEDSAMLCCTAVVIPNADNPDSPTTTASDFVIGFGACKRFTSTSKHDFVCPSGMFIHTTFTSQLSGSHIGYEFMYKGHSYIFECCTLQYKPA